MKQIEIATGLAAIAARYDGLILDLWGVVHDGASPYPGAADTLASLKAAGKKTILLSNAPRRGYVLVEGMNKMGIARELYGEVMSSGEAVHQELRQRSDPFYAALGQLCFHLGPERDRSIFDGLDIAIVPVEDADFMVNTGPIDFDQTVDDFLPALDRAILRDLPMVCANPDLVVIREGRPIICAGAIAVRYAEMGGTVSYRGKPDPAIYGIALKTLGVEDPRRVLVVGDAFHTDIAGATAAGLDSVLVAGGIHREELGIVWGDTPSSDKVEAAADRHGFRPNAVIPAFRW